MPSTVEKAGQRPVLLDPAFLRGQPGLAETDHLAGRLFASAVSGSLGCRTSQGIGMTQHSLAVLPALNTASYMEPLEYHEMQSASSTLRSAALFQSLPEFIQKQLLLARQSFWPALFYKFTCLDISQILTFAWACAVPPGSTT